LIFVVAVIRLVFLGFSEADRIQKTLQNPEPRTYNDIAPWSVSVFGANNKYIIKTMTYIITSECSCGS